ncbi:hypothetical protein HpBT260_14540 [Helicobacter pylori]
MKLISFITPKISSLEIYLRNALDYCLTQIKGSDWVFSENSLTDLINEQKKKEITHSLILSKMSLGAVIKLIFCYKLEGVALDLRAYSLKAYYKDNKDTLTLLIKGRKQHLSNYAKAYIALNLLWTIRNRAYHWENLLKLRANNRPRITTRFIRELEKPTSKSFNFGIMPNKIVSFLDDLIKSIGNKDLEKLSSL